MSRFFGFGNIRKFGHAVLASQRIQSSAVKRHGPLVTVGSSSSLLRFYSHYGCCSRGHASFTLFRAKNSLYRDQCLKNNTIAHHAQVAWKRLSQICSYSGPSFPPISKIACAVSLALTRSNLVAPSIVAFILGEMAGTKKTWADAQPLPRRDVLYRQAQDGHVYFTRFMFSILEGLILIFRAIYLTVLFSPTITMAPFANCLGVQFRKTWIHLVHLTLEKAGPAFIKWGQWAATRPDLFPKDLCIELSKLHTKAPSHSFAYTKKTIEKAFSRKLNDVFDDFEEKPIASGSIAQIHRATLKFRYPGQQVKPIVVAVKVRHPGVGESIRRDFVIIDLVAKFSNFIPTLQWLRLDESVQQFAVFMLSQVDLVREAHNLSRFIYNFRKWKDVSFPKPLYPLVHSAVLVETYEPGESVSRYVDDELECTTKVKCDLAHTGTQAFLQMVLIEAGVVTEDLMKFDGDVLKSLMESHRVIDIVGGEDGDVLKSSRSKCHDRVATLMEKVHPIDDSDHHEVQLKKTNSTPIPISIPRVKQIEEWGFANLFGSDNEPTSAIEKLLNFRQVEDIREETAGTSQTEDTGVVDNSIDDIGQSFNVARLPIGERDRPESPRARGRESLIGKPNGYGKYRGRIGNRPLLRAAVYSGLLLLSSKFVDEFFQRRGELIGCGVVSMHARQKDNFIHADMHPGNLLVREPQKKSSRKGLFKSKPHVIFLDVGMTAELSKSDQVNLQEFFKSVAIRNGSTAARCLLGLSERQNCPNPKAFIEEVEKSFRFWGTPEGAKVHPADCMHQLLEQVRRHKVNINGNVCTIMVTTLVLEGWQRKLDPKYNIMQTLQKLLVEHEWPEPLNPFK
ncbi:hypothetical protein GIB67_019961 [Kingdonia uniflora]|uniref:ABC1 atypical kinase-like domain-containing protein n=1 Tax=Kingdonia uniflora TaxID=39325 RepID=A0A7J7MKI7_9MAGN|nr:hypothetical protein GIB67_019961 [Kingdonia uniflora]